MVKQKGYTLVEVIFVVVVLGVIAGLAIPQYSKSVQRMNEERAVTQLYAIHAATNIYRARNLEYLDTGGATESLSYINSNLKLAIEANGVTYNYTSNGTIFTATASGSGYTVRINQNTISDINPCCVSGSCLSEPAC